MIDFLPGRYVREFCAFQSEEGDPMPALVRVVCDACRGRGSTWHGRIGRDAVSFTSGEWDELGHETQDDYMSGAYDDLCPICNGQRVVDLPDPEATPPAVWAAWEAFEQELYECDAIGRAEQRFAEGCSI